MDRRQFLVFTGGGAAAAAIAAWFAPGCSRRVSSGDPARGGPVKPETGRPLLALLVPPENSTDGYVRGQVVGGALNHGGDELLAELAGVDLVCVTPERLPPEAGPLGEPLPWFVLLTREGGKSTSRTFSPSASHDLAGGGLMSGRDYAQMNEAARASVQAFAAELHAFLLPSTGAAAGDRAARAGEARKRYVDTPPRGAHWAQSHGCGTQIEDVRPSQPMPACGMAMIPEVGRRFLHFYVKA